MTQLTDEQVAAMEKLVREMATGFGSVYADRAREIVATLPPPVDPDLVAAREWWVFRSTERERQVIEQMEGAGERDRAHQCGILGFLAGAAHARGEGE